MKRCSDSTMSRSSAGNPVARGEEDDIPRRQFDGVDLVQERLTFAGWRQHVAAVPDETFGSLPGEESLESGLQPCSMPLRAKGHASP